MKTVKRKKSKRLGRGAGSGKGKYCGRGTGGQKARAGAGIRLYFEGGQLPFVEKYPRKVLKIFFPSKKG